jgi:predicted kinase
MRVHYPRTPHLPWSPGATSDDVRIGDLSGLRGREVVVTEKLDGENTTLYRDGSHARSLDSAHHVSRAWTKALQGRIGGAIPEGWRVCGENVYARHALAYQDLDGFFYGFSVWDGDRCLPWDDTVRFLRRIGVPTPPVLWRGVFDEKALRALRIDPSRQEGYVVRTVEGFRRDVFGGHLAKWVRTGHVQESDTHWMFAEIVPNALGPRAALWAARSGAEVTRETLLAAVGLEDASESKASGGRDAEILAQTGARLDLLGRVGDARLAGLLAATLHDRRRATLAAELAAPLGLPLARRVADLVGLAPKLHRAHPDEGRRAGLVKMAFAADLGMLHALAAATAASGAIAVGGPTAASGPISATTTSTAMSAPADSREASEQVEWSALCAEDAGLLGEAPLAPLRTELRAALSGLDHTAADRCWAEARSAFAAGRIGSAAEAVAATWRWRAGRFPRLVQIVGPSGSGKSTFAAKLAADSVDPAEQIALIGLDDLRQARGSRSDQRHNDEVLGLGLDRLEAALAAGGTAVWDATSLTPQQRSLVASVARRRDALTTHAVLLVGAAELHRRNADRDHSVPADVLDAQLRRFVPPYPGDAHRTWYIGASGGIEDSDGELSKEDF